MTSTNANSKLIKFIKEARKRGFEDWQIRKPLLKQGWPEQEIEKAFKSLIKKDHARSTNQVTIHIDNELLKLLKKRADKNMLGLSDQITEILRRSALSMRNKSRMPRPIKCDDKLVGIFSRERRGRRKKKKR